MLRVGLCQLTSSADPAENLRLVREWTASAAARGARVVVFPEATMARFGVPLASLRFLFPRLWPEAESSETAGAAFHR